MREREGGFGVEGGNGRKGGGGIDVVKVSEFAC